ncbi:MAG: hypothetical protein AAGK21_16150 [Bacteroidota bacterium]
MRSLVLAALALLAAPAMSQDVVLRPGHPDLMIDGLTFESHTETVRARTPSARDLGTITHTVTRDGANVTVAVDADARQAGNTGETTITFNPSTLAPVSRQRAVGSSTGTTTYNGTNVSGSYGRGDWAPLAFDIDLRAPAFAPEMVPIVARALPFEVGYTATAPTFSSENRVRDVSMTVIGQEEFTRLDGSTASVWAIEATAVATRGGGTRRYLVDGSTRELLAATVSPQEGALIVTEPVTEEALAAMAEAEASAVVLRPGLDTFDPSVLSNESREFTIKVVQPVQQEAGTLTRSIMIDEAAGTITVTNMQEITMANQTVEQTLVAAYPSMAPISTSTTSGENVVEVIYADGIATRTSNGETTEVAYEEPVFSASMIFELARTIPLQEGYRAIAHVTGPEGPSTSTLTVGELGEIEGRMAWPVSAAGGPGQTFTFHVDAETREFVRFDQEPQVGVMIHIVPTEDDAGM